MSEGKSGDWCQSRLGTVAGRAKMESQIGDIMEALMNHHDALSDIWVRMSQYIYSTEIPLQLEQAERYHKQKIAELKDKSERFRAEWEGLSKLKLMEKCIPATNPPALPVSDVSLAETVRRPPSLPGGLRELCALEVVGDSMIDAGIHDGDIVLVRYQNWVENGEIAVIRLRDTGEMTLKRFYQEGGLVRLQPANKEVRPTYVDLRQVEVRGKFMRVLPQDG